MFVELNEPLKTRLSNYKMLGIKKLRFGLTIDILLSCLPKGKSTGQRLCLLQESDCITRLNAMADDHYSIFWMTTLFTDVRIPATLAATDQQGMVMFESVVAGSTLS